MIDIEIAKREFENYIKNYDITNPRINRKVYHSYRVMDCSTEIAKSLNLTDEQINLATLIGLLHDIARFEQARIYDTFSDIKSFDHGDYAIKILENDNFIRKFIKTDKYDNIIKTAIKNHNKFQIEDEITDEERLFSKIIRDADKLDIFFEAETMFWETDEEKEIIENSYISENYFEDFKKKKTLKKKDNQTKLDSIMIIIAFIFDINFKYSINEISEKDYINKILDKFSYKNSTTIREIEEIKKISKEYLNDNN